MTDTKEHYGITKHGGTSARRRSKGLREDMTFEIGLFQELVFIKRKRGEGAFQTKEAQEYE